MNDLLYQILKSDEAAREKLEKAEEYRREQFASLQMKKDEAAKEETAKAVSEAVRKAEKSKSGGEKQLQKIKERCAKAEKRMNELYKEKSAQWVDTIVKNVTEN